MAIVGGQVVIGGANDSHTRTTVSLLSANTLCSQYLSAYGCIPMLLFIGQCCSGQHYCSFGLCLAFLLISQHHSGQHHSLAGLHPGLLLIGQGGCRQRSSTFLGHLTAAAFFRSCCALSAHLALEGIAIHLWHKLGCHVVTLLVGQCILLVPLVSLVSQSLCSRSSRLLTLLFSKCRARVSLVGQSLCSRGGHLLMLLFSKRRECAAFMQVGKSDPTLAGKSVGQAEHGGRWCMLLQSFMPGREDIGKEQL
jgi:hypothetical protein